MSSFYNFIRENHILALIESAAEKRSSVLNLTNCEMKELPAPMMKLKDLTKLYLNNNHLSILPDEISNWEYLKVLTLDYNILTSVPPAIGRLTHLVCLNLSYNAIGKLPSEIGLLTKLEVLWLNHTQLEYLPPEIGHCIDLDTFGARGNFIKTLPNAIGNLHRLRWMTLEGNLLKELPHEIKGMYDLVHLNISNNLFESMPRLDELQGLQYVHMAHNYVTEVDKSFIERVEFIKTIDLRDNPISNINDCKAAKNIKLDESYVKVRENSQHEDSDSEDWEQSAPSSELDISETSEEEIPLDDPLAPALPQVARFTATGF